MSLGQWEQPHVIEKSLVVLSDLKWATQVEKATKAIIAQNKEQF
jgi:hypothetical protein